MVKTHSFIGLILVSAAMYALPAAAQTPDGINHGPNTPTVFENRMPFIAMTIEKFTMRVKEKVQLGWQ